MTKTRHRLDSDIVIKLILLKSWDYKDLEELSNYTIFEDNIIDNIDIEQNYIEEDNLEDDLI